MRAVAISRAVVWSRIGLRRLRSHMEKTRFDDGRNVIEVRVK
jgi:hypothetical protein